MTVSSLLAWIVGALLAQLAIGVALALWRARGQRGAVVAPPVLRPAAPTGAWPGWRDFRVQRRTLEDRAGTQCSFELVPVDGAALPAFLPGQFLTFQLQIAAGTDGSPRTVTRCYSLSDRPDPSHYRVTIKRVLAARPGWPAGVSSGHFHDQVQVGDVLKVKAPSGHFHIDRDAAVPVVLVGGGIGITPMMSMLRWCLDEQPGRTVHLFYGLRNSEEHAFKTVLEQLAQTHPALHLHVVYSRPGADDVTGHDHQHTGHVDVELIRRTLPHGRHSFYVCGPSPMMETLVPALSAWGVQAGDLHYEAFGPASLPATRSAPAQLLPGGAPLEIRFLRSGRSLSWDGQDANLLDFAERHGVVVDSGCRSGGCGSCETRLKSGTVAYASQPDHDTAPGHCLLCVGTPTSALELEA